MQFWEPWEGRAVLTGRNGGREEPSPRSFQTAGTLEGSPEPRVSEMAQKTPGATLR